jgi:hypothetical protein
MSTSYSENPFDNLSNGGSHDSDFFDRLEDFGFMAHVHEFIPDDFTAIYEIARVLEDKDNPLSEQLAPVMTLKEEEQESNPTEPPIPTVNLAHESEAHLIRNTRDVARIYPHQFLLPEKVFYHKLVQRSLWRPRNQAAQNFRYQSENDDFHPDSYKQKVYVLLDTSSSMAAYHRMHVAKAITYMFLKRNLRELGMVFFRTFDVNIGELKVARDRTSFTRLLSHVMKLNSFTDGAVYLDIAKVRALLGNKFTVNVVKIGSEKLEMSQDNIREIIRGSKDDTGEAIRKLYEREHDLEMQLRTVSSDRRKAALEQQLTGVKNRINDKVASYARTRFGKEVEMMASVFVNVDDIDEQKMFALAPEAIQRFRALTKEMINNLREDPNVKNVKMAALLHNHLKLLLPFNGDSNEMETLEESFGELQDALEQFADESLEGKTSGDASMKMSFMERKQISSMLRPVVSGKKISIGKLLRLLYLRWKRKFLLWRQQRRYQ